MEATDGGSEPRDPIGPVSSDGVIIAPLDAVEGVVAQEPSLVEGLSSGVRGSLGSMGSAIVAVFRFLDELAPEMPVVGVALRSRFALRSCAEESLKASMSVSGAVISQCPGREM